MANGDWRGLKGDAYEGGHRVPFIARWPGRIPENALCDNLITLEDFMATSAENREGFTFVYPVLYDDWDATKQITSKDGAYRGKSLFELIRRSNADEILKRGRFLLKNSGGVAHSGRDRRD